MIASPDAAGPSDNGAGPGDDVADVVAEVAASCPGVVRLASGSPVEVATYLPGRRVHGVRVTADGVEVHVVARHGAVLPELAESVRQAVAKVVPTQVIDVFVDDLDVEPDPDPEDDAHEAPEAVSA